VYKNGETNVISSPIIRLIDVFSIAGGFSPVDKGIIDIFKNGDKIKSYNHIDVLSNPMLEIEKGSYIVITPETKYSYITILGNTAPQSLRTDVQINLVELLATAKIDWDVQESVIIYTPENEREVIKIENIENLRSKFVSPGSILFIPSLVDQVVYVFGEVTRPGIIAYNKGMTLIDAILKAGNVQNSAQLSSVYFFEDGHENAPKKLDISDLIKKTPLKSGMNPELKPGDIIFISKNSLTGVLEVMSTVGTFMQFINTSFTMYGNISSLF
jgi:protein involved in polysaccharide export with SLBB domain